MLKTKRQKARFLKSVIKTLIILIVVGLVAAFAVPRVLSIMGYGPKPPIFVFESTLAPGWVSEGNINPQDSVKGQYETSQIKKLPVASLAVLQRESEESKNCFVAFSYFDYPEDSEKLQKNIEEQTASDKTLIVKKLEPYRSKLDTPEGKKEFTLHQYDLQSTKGEKMLRGAAHGYIELNKAYIEIRAYCDTAQDLNVLSLPLGLGAVKLKDETKQ